jgi:tape measure domain-containing protein
MSGTTVDAGKLLIQVEATTENLKRQLDAALSAVDDAARGMQASVTNVNRSFDSMGDAVDGALKGFTTFISGLNPLTASMAGVVAGGIGIERAFEKITEQVAEYVTEIAKAGDEHTAFIAQMTAITGSTDLATEAFEKLEEQALSTGTSVSTSVDMFKKFSVAASEVGLSGDEVQRLIKTLQEAGVVAGATSEQLATVSTGISVGFEQGQMSARQFRTILTEMPSLAKAMADSLNVSVGTMASMARQGQLTADVVRDALGGAAAETDKKFADMPETMSRAYKEAQDGMAEFNAAVDKALGLSKLVAATWHLVGEEASAAAKAITPATELEKTATEIQKVKDAIQVLDDQIAKRQSPTGDIAANLYGGVSTEALQRQLDEQKALLKKAQDEQYQILSKGAQEQQQADSANRDASLQAQQDALDKSLQKTTDSLDKRAAAYQKYNDTLTQLQKDENTIVAGDQSADAQAKRTEIDRDRTLALKDLNDELEKIAKSEEVHDKAAEAAAKKMQNVVDETQRAAEAAQRLLEVHKQGTQAIQDMTTQNDIWNKIAEAGIPDTDDLTDAQWKMRDAIVANVTAQQTAIDAMTNYDEAQKQQAEALKKYGDDIKQHATQIANDVSTAFFDALTGSAKGSTFVDYFKTLFKRIAVEALSANIVLPITTQIVGSMPGLFGVSQPSAGGGGVGQVIGTINSAGQLVSGSSVGGGGSMFGGISNLLGIGNLADSLGITSLKSTVSGLFGGSTGAIGSFLSSGIGGTSLSEAATLSAGVGAPVEATGLFGGASVGGLLGGAGAGYAAGSLLNSLVGGHPLGGNIGSGVGAAAGAAIGSIVPGVGTLIGGLIGGAGGGLLGGIIGPGKKHMAFGITEDVTGNQIEVQRSLGSDTQALQSTLADSNQQIAQINSLIGSLGGQITVLGRAVQGAGNNVDQASSFAESLSRGEFKFYGQAGTDYATALASKGNIVQSPQDLQNLVTAVQNYEAAIAGVDKQTNQYTQQIDAINQSYDAAIANAQAYGLATDKLSQAQADAVAQVTNAQQSAIQAAEGAVTQAAQQAQGQTSAAQIYGLDIAKQPALDQLKTQLEGLGVTADDVTKYVNMLSDALDLQRKNTVEAITQQTTATVLQEQVDAATARGQTYQAAVIKQQIDNTAAIKNLSDTLTALGLSADDSAVYVNDLTAALDQQAQATAAARGESIRQLTANAQIELLQAQGANDPAIKAQADMAALIEQQYEDAQKLYAQLTALGATSDQVTQALKYLSEAQQDERDTLKANAQATVEATNAAGQSIQAYIDKLNATSAGGASPQNQLAAAKEIFGQQLALAKGGDQTALSNITSNADALLQAGKAMYGSTSGYQQIVGFIKESLTGLPATENYQAEILAALKDLGGSIDVNVQLSVIRSITEQLEALPQDDLNKLQVTKTILHTVEEQMGKQLTTADFNHLLQVQGMDATVIQKVDQIMTGMTPDQFAQVLDFSNLPATVQKTVIQAIKNSGSAEITPDPITKQITQDVKTNEAITVHISDTLDNIFQLIYAEETEQVKYLWAIAQNTSQLTNIAGGKGYGYTPNALGNVFPFAGGGVVSVPTYAPLALFGEAGPEAIMPLKRDASGRLGVSATPGNDNGGPDVVGAVAQVGSVLRDELRALRGDIQDVRAVLRRAVAQ